MKYAVSALLFTCAMLPSNEYDNVNDICSNFKTVGQALASEAFAESLDLLPPLSDTYEMGNAEYNNIADVLTAEINLPYGSTQESTLLKDIDNMAIQSIDTASFITLCYWLCIARRTPGILLGKSKEKNYTLLEECFKRCLAQENIAQSIFITTALKALAKHLKQDGIYHNAPHIPTMIQQSIKNTITFCTSSRHRSSTLITALTQTYTAFQEHASHYTKDIKSLWNT